MAKIGYGLTKQDLPLVVKDVLNQAEADGLLSVDERKFKNNLPSKGWTYAFLSRHSNLSARRPENLGFQRACITEDAIREWFNGLSTFLKEEHGIDAERFFTEANLERIYNADESGFPLQGTAGKCQVIVERGTKNIHRLAPDSKTQITVLSCVSAAGTFSKPFVLFPGKKLPKFNLTDVSEDDFDLGYSDSGWISSDTFFGWLSNLFYPSVKDKVQFPIILFIDGHTSHVNIAVSDFCRDHDIILHCFPAHASHILQPLDVSVFGPLKKSWNKSIKEFYMKFRTPMTKNHFFPVFDRAWKETCAKPQNAVSGFRSTGLVPFNVDNVDFSKLLDSKAVEKFRVEKTRIDSPIAEKVGLMRALTIVEKELDVQKLELFDTRFKNGYDVVVDSDSGRLWRIYAKLRRSLEKNAPSQVAEKSTNVEAMSIELPNEDRTFVEHSTQLPQNECTPTEPSGPPLSNDSDIVIALDEYCGVYGREPSPPVVLEVGHSPVPGPSNFLNQDDTLRTLSTSRELLTSTPTKKVHRPTNTFNNHNDQEDDENVSNTAAEEPSTSYSNFENSPFKTYLKISDNVIMSRKSGNKSKMPNAITGKVYNETLKFEQKRKSDAEAQKKRRKEEREKKKAGKQLKCRTVENPVGEHSSDDEIEISYQDDADFEALMELIQQPNTACATCFGTEQLNVKNAWIGCSTCEAWIHRGCVSRKVERMTEAQIRKLNFVCLTCKNKRTTKKTSK